MNNILISFLLALLAMFIHTEYLMGTCMLSRPIVVAALTGLIIGDPTKAIILGANFELAFIGAIAIGATLPPDMISGTILGVAFAVVSGNADNPGVSLSLGLAIASLVIIIKNVLFILVMPYFIHKADIYAEESDYKGIQRMHFLSGFFTTSLPLGIIVGLSFYFGNAVVKDLIDKIPDFIVQGLTIATGLLPAYGLALLLKLILNKNNFIYLVFGFALAVYMKIPITGIAIFSLILAVLLTNLTNIPNYNCVSGSRKEREENEEEF